MSTPDKPPGDIPLGRSNGTYQKSPGTQRDMIFRQTSKNWNYPQHIGLTDLVLGHVMVVTSWASNCAVHKPSLMLPMSCRFQTPKRNCEQISKRSYGEEKHMMKHLNIIHLQVVDPFFGFAGAWKKVKHSRPTCPTRSPPSMGPRNGDAQWRVWKKPQLSSTSRLNILARLLHCTVIQVVFVWRFQSSEWLWRLRGCLSLRPMR